MRRRFSNGAFCFVALVSTIILWSSNSFADDADEAQLETETKPKRTTLKDVAEVNKFVRQEYGGFVPKEEMPEFYQMLEGITRDLTEAQRRTTHSDRVLVNEIKILRTSLENALVATLEENGVKAQRNLVYITTGMLQKLFPSDKIGTYSKEELVSRLNMTAGVLLHELGHPVDSLTEISLQKRKGRQGQPIEIRADFDGIDLAREAHYRESAIYEIKKERAGLSKPTDEPSVITAFRKANSSHPDLQFNLALLRSREAMNRFNRGTKPEDGFDKRVKKTDFRAIAREIKKIPVERSDGFVPPKTVSEAANKILELDKSAKYFMKGEPDTTLLNNYLLSLDQLLLERQKMNQPLNPAEKSLVNKGFARLINIATQDGKIYSAQLFRDLAPDSFPPGSLSHYEFATKIDYFKSPDFLNLIRSKLDETEKHLREQMKSYTRYASIDEELRTYRAYFRSTRLADPDSAMKTFESNIAREVKSWTRSANPASKVAAWVEHNLMDATEHQAEAAILDVAERYIGSSTQDKVGFASSLAYGKDGETYGAFPRYRASSEVALAEVKESLITSFESATPEKRKRLKAIYEQIWKDRGLYQFLSDLQESPMEWSSIAKVLRLDPKTVPQEVDHEFHRFIREDARVPQVMEEVVKLNRAGAFETGHNPPEITDSHRRARTELAVRLGEINDVSVRTSAQTTVDATYLKRDIKEVQRRYREALRPLLSVEKLGSSPSLGKFLGAHKEAVDSLNGVVGYTYVKQIWAEELSASNLPESAKKLLLRSLFLEHPGMFGLSKTEHAVGAGKGLVNKEREAAEAKVRKKLKLDSNINNQLGFDWVSTNPENRNSVMKALKKHGVINEATDVLRASQSVYNPIRTMPGAEKDIASTHSQILTGLIDDIRIEIESAARLKTNAERLKALNRIADDVFNPTGKNFSASASTWAHEQTSRNFLKATAQLQLTADEALQFFHRAVKFGASQAADEFFMQTVLPKLPEPKDRLVAGILKDRRILSEATQIELAKIVFEPANRRFMARRISDAELLAQMQRLESLVPRASVARDTMIGNWAWDWNLDSEAKLGLVESYKSSNLARIDFSKMRWVSGALEHVGRIDAEARIELYEYVARPQGKPFPAHAESELRRVIREDSLIERFQGSELETAIDRTFENVRSKIITAVRDSAPIEKVPALDLLLNIGADPIVESKDYPRNLYKYIGVTEGTNDAKRLRAFLDPSVTPESQKSVVLSYLASLEDGAGTSRINHIFNAFGFPGYRAGQEAKTWRLLPPEFDKDLAELYDNADPESKAKVQEILNKRFPNRKLRVKKLLGSASTVTVVGVEWDEVDREGRKVVREAAALVRREHAIEQLNAHMKAGRAYLEGLEKEGLSTQAKFMRELIDAQEKAMLKELDFRNVADNLRRLKETFEGSGYRGSNVNQAMQMEKQGWKFRVPEVYDGANQFGQHEDILFMEKANGMTFRKASDEARRIAGPLIGESVAKTLFSNGYQANPHAGNFMVDFKPGRKTNEIWLLDGGQIGSMSTGSKLQRSEAYSFAQFVRAVNEKDAAAVSRFAQELSMNKPSGLNKAAFEKSIAAALNEEKGLDTLFPRLLGVFSDNGVHIQPKYVFTGGLKSLMDASGADFFKDPVDFKKAVAAEVKSTILGHPVAAVTDAVKAASKAPIDSCATGFAKLMGAIKSLRAAPAN